MSPLDIQVWQEALRFYEQSVFHDTGQRIALIRDTLNWQEQFEEELSALHQEFSYLIAETRTVDFASMFEEHQRVLCPAGKEYFRIWNDGSVQGCPMVGELSNLGNIKERSFTPRNALFECTQPRHCDCHHISSQGKMRFPEKTCQVALSKG